jgi:hypothetical protein
MLSLMLMYALWCGKCEIIRSLGKDDRVNKKGKWYSIFHVQGTGPTPGHDDQKGFGAVTTGHRKPRRIKHEA